MVNAASSDQSALMQATRLQAKTQAQQAQSGASGSAGSQVPGANALGSIANNYTTFLSMLTTQLKNQDPSNPMTSDNFTSELAQFSGVEQQVQTNSNLSSLISLTQGESLLSGQQIAGKSATFSGSSLPLQNGIGALSFTLPSAEPVAIAVSDSSGNIVKTDSVSGAAGVNQWSWNGIGDDGVQRQDGAYTIAIEAQGAGGQTSAVAPTLSGVVNSVANSTSGVMLNVGKAAIPIGNLVGVGG